MTSGNTTTPILTYHRPPRRYRRLVIRILLLAMVYLIGYAMLRADHDLVRAATWYTGDNGTLVHTDAVRLGAWRAGPAWTAIAIVCLPLRLTEGCYWQLGLGTRR